MLLRTLMLSCLVFVLNTHGSAPGGDSLMVLPNQAYVTNPCSSPL
uniref:Uncharacterized protein n=1 Tax=Picea glauca TaxID=3330 RepID=A0A101M0S4_PICGL|nr:hypothetical protein ABT39_MTgene4155 [Picea glauca]